MNRPCRACNPETYRSRRGAQVMDILTIIRIAIRALARNKMRSGLTMLGIIIGVAAVIAMVGIGEGAQAAQQAQIAAMGSNMLFVSSGTVNRGGIRLSSGAT